MLKLRVFFPLSAKVIPVTVFYLPPKYVFLSRMNQTNVASMSSSYVQSQVGRMCESNDGRPLVKLSHGSY